jgi:glycosyltransferase involved in cell wall biosynthesis
MKVVLLSFLYEPELGGGAAVVVNQLAHALFERAIDVVVITTWKANYIKSEVIDGIKIVRIPPMNLYWVGEKDNQAGYKKVIWQLMDIWNPLVYRSVRQILINEKADIVHSHKLRGLSPSIWSAAASAGVNKIVHTCHDYELLSPEGLLMGKVGRLAQGQNIVMRPYQNLRRYYSKLVNVALAPSKFVMNYHQKMGFFYLARTKIIPNSHGFNAYKLQKNAGEFTKLEKKDFARRFLYLGRLEKAKGIDVLCRAFLRVASQNSDFRLTIAGWGSLETSLMEKYKYQHNIVFAGSVSGSRKAELFHENDVLVAPSIAQEAFGIVLTEAYSFGLPVIASRIGAYPEIVREGKTGFMVNPGSEDDLFSMLVRVGEVHSLPKALGVRCLEEAGKYTSERFIGDYLDVYQEVS